MRKCDSCGKLYQETKDVFCPHCGAVAQKQCVHSSSFDSGRYNRGEIYTDGNSDYKNTTYNSGYEPHVQRKQTAYSSEQTTFGNKGSYGNKIPEINLPDFKKVFSKGNAQNGKIVGAVVFVCILAFNFLISNIGTDISDENALWADISEVYVDEDISELYTIVDSASIELVDTEGDFKTFTLEIRGMGFDDYLPENMQNDILSGNMSDEILSENTFVEILLCDFSKNIVAEESYNNAIEDSYYYTGKRIDGSCKYEFVYSFGYDEIVHIGSGVSFYLDNGLYINAELPFSAFSISEDGEVTYYTSYAGSGTAWNTVFEECPNEQDIGRDVYIDFGGVVSVAENEE